MKNHVIRFNCPREYFFASEKIAHGHNHHLTPYQPTMRTLKVFITICGQKGYGDYFESAKTYRNISAVSCNAHSCVHIFYRQRNFYL